MLVPALAFAWWLVSLPNHSLKDTSLLVTESMVPVPPHLDARRRSADEMASENTAATELTADHDAAGAIGPTQEPSDSLEERDFRRVLVRRTLTPTIVRAARSFLDLPMGAERTLPIDGQRYVFVLEWHYHPPGFVGGPTGWHKGVTVYELRPR